MADDDLDFTCPPEQIASHPRIKLPKATQETLSRIRRQLDTGNTWATTDASARRILAAYAPKQVIDRSPSWVLAALRQLREEMNGDTDFAAEMVYAAEYERHHSMLS